MNQNSLKIGISCGIVGILLIHAHLPAFSSPPAQTQNPSVESLPETQPTTPKGQKLPLSAQMTVKGKTILLEVARTANEQATGLMYRTELAADRGMLFSFSPARAVSFWMKNTLIPLDMIFVSNGVVKYIGANIQPCQADPCPGYNPSPNIPVDSVIELRAGRAAELKLKVGDRIKIRNYSAKMLKKI